MNDSIDLNKKRKKKGWSFKKRLPLSILAGLSLAISFFCGIFEVYSSNSGEFDFVFKDFSFYAIIFSIAIFIVASSLLLLLRGKAFDITFALLFFISFMTFIQSSFLNFGINSLSDDGISGNTGLVRIILNLALWIIILALFILSFLLFRKRKILRYVSIYALSFIILIQLISFTYSEISTNALEKESLENVSFLSDEYSETDVPMVLTEKNLFKVSEKNNIIIFIIDRLDSKYVRKVMSEYPEEFDFLDGFTYYDDNISLYTRTYPGGTSIITGKTNDFENKASSYFESAYNDSEFLADLKSNDYEINIYGDKFYLYRDARELLGIASNVSGVCEYRIKERFSLFTNLVKLMLYRSSPHILKNVYNLSTSSFKGFVYIDSDDSEYSEDDYKYYEKLKDEGITLDNNKNVYTYIHLQGCHNPYALDENANKSKSGGSSEKALRGCLKFIKEYIDGLKENGLYKNATIVITGDHPDPVSDYDLPDVPKQTGLFFKKSGDCDYQMIISDKPVSQDMLIPSLVASSGIKSQIDTKDSYWDSQSETRRYLFIRNLTKTSHDIVEYEITGDGSDFDNWKIKETYEIGYLYK